MALGLLTPDARLRVFSDGGVVLPGAKLWTFVSGSPATPLATYSDSALTVPNANPIVASAGGLFGPIYLTPGVAYKLLLTDSLGVTVPGWPADPVMMPFTTLAAGAGVSVVTVGGVTTISLSGGASSGANDFRLTLTSGLPVTTADVVAATTMYCTPKGGNRIALFDAAGVATVVSSAEFSIALPAVASQLYDVFCWNNAGVPTLELLAWTNDTTRATLLTLATTGVATKVGDLTRRYLGTVRTTTVAGQTEDSLLKRLLWNAYQRQRRPMLKQELTTSWTYTLATIRQARGDVTNQLEFVSGINEWPVEANVQVSASNSSPSVQISAGIALDSTTTFGGEPGTLMSQVSNNNLLLTARWKGYPGVGRHVLSWNEYSGATGVTSWFSSGGGGSAINSLSGIAAFVEG